MGFPCLWHGSDTGAASLAQELPLHSPLRSKLDSGRGDSFTVAQRFSQKLTVMSLIEHTGASVGGSHAYIRRPSLIRDRATAAPLCPRTQDSKPQSHGSQSSGRTASGD